MKYIKTFEKNKSKERMYKDFVVAKSLKNLNIPLFVLSTDQEKFKDNDSQYHYKNYSYYKPNEKYLTSEYLNSSINIKNLLIIYQSDDLQECIDMLPILLSQNKFNL